MSDIEALFQEVLDRTRAVAGEPVIVLACSPDVFDRYVCWALRQRPEPRGRVHMAYGGVPVVPWPRLLAGQGVGFTVTSFRAVPPDEAFQMGMDAMVDLDHRRWQLAQLGEQDDA